MDNINNTTKNILDMNGVLFFSPPHVYLGLFHFLYADIRHMIEIISKQIMDII